MNIDSYISEVNSYLESCIKADAVPYKGLADSMLYSLNAGGKRIRPILVLEFCRISGGDVKAALPVACAIEMLHTYSLIHDDLPCMDNDDYRRGKPTNHKVFGETTAVIAGDALQTEAFRLIMKSELDSDRKVRCCTILSDAAGLDGMCGGQYLDTVSSYDSGNTASLDIINSLKTGALLSAACMMGVAAAGGSDEQIKAAEVFGKSLGAAFQIRDDVLDVIGNKEILGKDIGSDCEENKPTYMSLLGEDKCMECVCELTGKAKAALKGCFIDCGFLCSFADSMIWRVS